MNQRRLLQLAVGAVVALLAGPASAQVTDRKLDRLPVAQVDRPLTLPKFTLGAGIDGSLTHFEIGDDDGLFEAKATGGFLDIGGNFGILDDLEVEAVVLSLGMEEYYLTSMGADAVDKADWGMSRLGATFRFFATDAAEIGARFRFLIDNNATIGFNGGLPIRLRVPGVFRFDTGFHFTGIVPTVEGASAVFALVDVNSNPMGPDPGIPLRFTINPIEELWLAFHTGVGVGDVGEDNSVFLPFGLGLGGTIEIKKILLDLSVNFNFPLLFLPAVDFDPDTDDESIGTELWQFGFGLKTFVPLGG